MCCVQYSAHLRYRALIASSRASRAAFQALCGIYFPGCIGRKSLIALPNTHMEGDTLVTGSGVFLYWRSARRKLSLLRPPLGSVFVVIKRFAVSTPSSPLQFECGKYADDCMTHTPITQDIFCC